MDAHLDSIVERVYPSETIHAIRQFDGGETHVTAKVLLEDQDPVVLKVTRDGGDRLRRDRAALQYVREMTDIPVPGVVTSGAEPAPWYVMELIEGQNTPQLSDFDLEDPSAYLKEAGEILATLHETCSFETPGRLEGTSDGELVYDTYPSWPALYRVLKHQTITELDGTRFEDVTTDARNVLPEVTSDLTVDRPVLAHCDFGPNNVFHVDGTVTGVIDWEWCLVADPAYDLYRAERLFRQDADDGTRDALCAGYETVRSVPQAYEDRARIYAAFETLSPMSSFDSWGPNDEETATEWAEQLRDAFYSNLPVNEE